MTSVYEFLSVLDEPHADFVLPGMGRYYHAVVTLRSRSVAGLAGNAEMGS